ncbi:MAG: tRNA (adenosine(37)-N6)-threonylcarbamoyltransferase complex dimerization subunit type 1 TsaB [Clostridia bacterium]|nr:tRNA (adenosine(37)-N6)-threonylcarbamoyltransferase complex dimerization subunit type 1 TsaB [Clostridia bacterium]
MKILGIDTSASTAAAALAEDERILARISVAGTRMHSETMLPMVQRLMESARIGYDEIDLYAAASCPGSYTGVRIGVSLIKGLAFGRGKICIGVSSLAALARELEPLLSGRDRILVCPLMDARRDRMYYAVFSLEREKDGFPACRRLTPDSVDDLSRIREELGAYGEPVCLTGDGCGKGLEAFSGLPVTEAPEALRYSTGLGVIREAVSVFRSSPSAESFTDLALKPGYLRPSSAERARNSSED